MATKSKKKRSNSSKARKRSSSKRSVKSNASSRSSKSTKGPKRASSKGSLKSSTSSKSSKSRGSSTSSRSSRSQASKSSSRSSSRTSSKRKSSKKRPKSILKVYKSKRAIKREKAAKSMGSNNSINSMNSFNMNNASLYGVGSMTAPNSNSSMYGKNGGNSMYTMGSMNRSMNGMNNHSLYGAGSMYGMPSMGPNLMMFNVPGGSFYQGMVGSGYGRPFGRINSNYTQQSGHVIEEDDYVDTQAQYADDSKHTVEPDVEPDEIVVQPAAAPKPTVTDATSTKTAPSKSQTSQKSRGVSVGSKSVNGLSKSNTSGENTKTVSSEKNSVMAGKPDAKTLPEKPTQNAEAPDNQSLLPPIGPFGSVRGFNEGVPKGNTTKKVDRPVERKRAAPIVSPLSAKVLRETAAEEKLAASFRNRISPKVPAEKQNEGAKLTSPLKETPSAAPPAAAEKSVVKPPPKPLVITGERKITNNFGDSVHTIVMNNSNHPRVGVKGDTIQLDNKTYKVAEAHTNFTPFELYKSEYLVHLTEEVHCGHVASVVCLCGDNNKDNVAYSQTLVTQMAANIMQRLQCASKEKTEKYVTTLSGFTFPSSNRDCKLRDVMVKDVLSASGDHVVAQFGSNPLTGPTVLGVKEEPVRSAADVQTRIDQCVKAFNLEEDESLMMQLHIMQIRAPKEVYVTSITFILINHLQEMFELRHFVANTKTKHKDGTLFSYVFGGPSRTAVVFPISPSEAKSITALKEAMSDVQGLNAIENKPSRSGSISRFIQMTKLPIQRGAVKDERIKERMQTIIAEANKIMEDPEKNKFPSYPIVMGGDH
ncbi:hypothetical protein, conserved [Angomonas deanei]|uniref:Uncharacterized protein n=1 Tax=Angomonas deanei TaxID=59799 RepID=A0A7G2C251_9TRYP|nr:hypothetical protein, conserved [Angomonas deanei]